MPSGENPRYYGIVYSSWPNICIHSLEGRGLLHRISSVTLIIPNFVECLSSNTLFKLDTTELQIQRTIPLSADVKRRIVSLNAGHVSQPYSKLFLIQELKMLTRFLSKMPRLVMIGNSYIKPFHAAVMCALVASTKPPDSPTCHQGIEKLAQLRMYLQRHVLGWN